MRSVPVTCHERRRARAAVARGAACALGVVLLWPARVGAQAGGNAPSDSARATVTRQRARQLRDSLGLAGLQAAVAVNGAVVVAVNAGFADVERNVPLEGTSRFRIGSVSKLLTVTAAVRLHQAGRLDLDAPIARYLRDVPADKATVTSRQLGGHIAGFGHYGRDDYINTTSYRDVMESLGALLSKPLVAAPGSRYAYSSYGFNVLGAVLQGAAGTPFPKVIEGLVSRPLGMAHTQVEESRNPPASRARLYSRGADGALLDAPAADLTDRWPSGGFLSTAEDLSHLAQGVLDTTYLSAEVREVLFAPQQTADGKATAVGLGWRVARDARGRRYVHHGGDSSGGRAFVLLYPEQRVSVVLLTNLTFAPLGEKEALVLAAPWLPPS